MALYWSDVFVDAKAMTDDFKTWSPVAAPTTSAFDISNDNLRVVKFSSYWYYFESFFGASPIREDSVVKFKLQFWPFFFTQYQELYNKQMVFLNNQMDVLKDDKKRDGVINLLKTGSLKFVNVRAVTESGNLASSKPDVFDHDVIKQKAFNTENTTYPVEVKSTDDFIVNAEKLLKASFNFKLLEFVNKFTFLFKQWFSGDELDSGSSTIPTPHDFKIDTTTLFYNKDNKLSVKGVRTDEQ